MVAADGPRTLQAASCGSPGEIGAGRDGGFGWSVTARNGWEAGDCVFRHPELGSGSRRAALPSRALRIWILTFFRMTKRNGRDWWIA